MALASDIILREKPREGLWGILVDKKVSAVGEEQKTECAALGGRKMVWFEVEGKPIAKERPRLVGGRVYTPSKTKGREEEIGYAYKEKYHGFKFEPGAPLRLEVDAFFCSPKSASKKKKALMEAGKIRPTVRNGDADNVLKTVADGGNGVAYDDDAQIVEMECRKFYSERPRTEVRIMRIDDEE